MSDKHITMKELAALEALHGKATQGEWFFEDSSSPLGGWALFSQTSEDLTPYIGRILHSRDADAIVALHNSLPRLATTLREALVLLGELVGEREAGTEWWDNPNGDWGWTCAYCGEFTSRGKAWEPEPEQLTHADTCPIARARELLKGEGDAANSR